MGWEEEVIESGVRRGVNRLMYGMCSTSRRDFMSTENESEIVLC
jgi:hypothetical protein